MEKYLVIGKGRWAQNIINILKEDFKLSVDNTTRDYISIDLKKYERIFIIVDPDNNMEILKYCLENSPAKIYIEKPFALSSKDFTDDILKNGRIFVGNKFIYSPSLIEFKEKLKNEKVTGIFTRWVKSKNCGNCGIFFDILYHHLYILEYLFDMNINVLQKHYFTPTQTSGILLCTINNIPVSMEGSSNGLYDHFENSIRIETDSETFIINEDSGDNTLNIINNEKKTIDCRETIYHSLKAFLSKNNFIDIQDVNIIQQLEK